MTIQIINGSAKQIEWANKIVATWLDAFDGAKE